MNPTCSSDLRGRITARIRITNIVCEVEWSGIIFSQLIRILWGMFWICLSLPYQARLVSTGEHYSQLLITLVLILSRISLSLQLFDGATCHFHFKNFQTERMLLLSTPAYYLVFSCKFLKIVIQLTLLKLSETLVPNSLLSALLIISLKNW